VPLYSTYCELHALLAALVSGPRTAQLVYWTDSQALAEVWSTRELPVRQELRRTSWPHLKRARALASRFTHPVQVPWTPGHDTPGHDTRGYDTPGHDTRGYDTPGHDTRGYDTPGHAGSVQWAASPSRSPFTAPPS
jgi:hypothetical protein